MEDDFKKKLEGKSVSLGVIDMQAYGMMNGKKVLEQAYTLMG